MSTVLVSTPSATGLWVDLLRQACPGRTVYGFQDADPIPRTIDDLLIWKPTGTLFRRITVRRSIFCLGAGVDGILSTPGLPVDVPLFRLVDSGMAPQMAAWCSYAVLHYMRDMDAYQDRQSKRQWQPEPYRAPEHFPVGILGAGTLGTAVAASLAGFGIPVTGWRRTRPGCTATPFPCVTGPTNLDALLANSHAILCLLPLTQDTRGIINAGFMARMAKGSVLINASRGELIVEDDLVDALDRGHLRGAFLDVANQEPLPPHSALWNHPGVRLTPHVAANTVPEHAVKQIASALDRLDQGERPPGYVDRCREY